MENLKEPNFTQKTLKFLYNAHPQHSGKVKGYRDTPKPLVSAKYSTYLKRSPLPLALLDLYRLIHDIALYGEQWSQKPPFRSAFRKLASGSQKTIIFSVINHGSDGQASRFDSTFSHAGVALTARLLLFNINFAKLKSIFP